jgi:hypothetical protein
LVHAAQDFGAKEAEKVWSFVHKAIELDEAKRAEGSDLDEFQAHRFLEHFKETLTVQVTPPPRPTTRTQAPAPVLFRSRFVLFVAVAFALSFAACCSPGTGR